MQKEKAKREKAPAPVPSLKVTSPVQTATGFRRSVAKLQGTKRKKSVK